MICAFKNENQARNAAQKCRGWETRVVFNIYSDVWEIHSKHCQQPVVLHTDGKFHSEEER